MCRFIQHPIRPPAPPLVHPALSQSDTEAGPKTASLCFHWHWPLGCAGLSSALMCNTRPFCRTDLRLSPCVWVCVWCSILCVCIYRWLSLMWCAQQVSHIEWDRMFPKWEERFAWSQKNPKTIPDESKHTISVRAASDHKPVRQSVSPLCQVIVSKVSVMSHALFHSIENQTSSGNKTDSPRVKQWAMYGGLLWSIPRAYDRYERYL